MPSADAELYCAELKIKDEKKVVKAELKTKERNTR